MTTTQIVLVVALVAVIALLVIARASGPRVTHIETRRDDRGTGE